MSRLWIGLVTLLAVLALSIWSFKAFQPRIAEHLLVKLANRTISATPREQDLDALFLYVCGSGSPMPNPDRAGPCLAVTTPEHALVFDTGAGSVSNLGVMRFPMERVDAAFLTHLHSDHLDGLGEFMLQAWIFGTRDTPIPIFGPTGTADVVEGFNQAYQIDSIYRFAHHGSRIANLDGYGGIASEIRFDGGADIVYRDGALTVTAFRVDHNPVEPAFGYRIDYKGRSITISGDTIYDENLVAAATGTDLLAHDVLHRDMVRIIGEANGNAGRVNLAEIAHDIQDYHASPVDAARAAHESDAGALLMYHVVPPLPSRFFYPLFLEGTDAAYAGPITIAEDGMVVVLPADSNEIRHRSAR